MPKEKVLAIDDELHVRHLLVMLLESGGFEVKTANNAEEGLETASTFEPDLIITDYKMPGPLSGIDMICILRDEEFGKDIPVILLSGSASAASRVRAKIDVLTNVIHLSKPFNLRKLVSLVEQTIEENRSCERT